MGKLKCFNIFFIAAVTLLLMSGTAVSAQKSSQQGAKVYVALAGNEEHAGDVKEEVIRQLQDWGYWKLVSSKKDADRCCSWRYKATAA